MLYHRPFIEKVSKNTIFSEQLSDHSCPVSGAKEQHYYNYGRCSVMQQRTTVA